MTRGLGTGNTVDRRRRREWLVETFAADVSPMTTGLGFDIQVCRCYRCGRRLWSGTETIQVVDGPDHIAEIEPLTVDRIVPGCLGGTYRRNNIRPACGPCNYSTGALLRGTKR